MTDFNPSRRSGLNRFHRGTRGHHFSGKNPSGAPFSDAHRRGGGEPFRIRQPVVKGLMTGSGVDVHQAIWPRKKTHLLHSNSRWRCATKPSGLPT